MSPNKIFLLGFTIPDDMAKRMFELDPNPATQTHSFGWSLTRALSTHNQLTLISSIPIQNYPLANKIFFGGGKFSVENISGFYVPFINLLIFKHLTRLISTFFILIYLYKVSKPQAIFIHGVHSPYLLLAALLSSFDIKTAVIVTDPPGVIKKTDSFLARYLKNLDAKLVKYLLNKSGLVVSLSPKLLLDLDKPKFKLTFPGFLNKNFKKHIDISINRGKRKKNNKFRIVYAGGLHKEYGVRNLVDAVLTLNKNLEIELLLFGKGNELNYIKEVSSIDSRIIYGGFVNNAQVALELTHANLLINPRPTDLEFASLSFPSKLIEYMYSGTPILTTRIQSIPDNFKDCFFFIDDESIEGIQKSILTTFNLTEDERKIKSEHAKNTVTEYTSEDYLATVINSALKKLIKES